MIDAELFSSVARQLMTGDSIQAGGRTIPVRRTSSQCLRTVAFTIGGRQYAAIEQNATKPSKWGELARAGHQVVQFKDAKANRFIAVAVDGEVREYGRRTPTE